MHIASVWGGRRQHWRECATPQANIINTSFYHLLLHTATPVHVCGTVCGLAPCLGPCHCGKQDNDRPETKLTTSEARLHTIPSNERAIRSGEEIDRLGNSLPISI